jgi:hypothetical protein
MQGFEMGKTRFKFTLEKLPNFKKKKKLKLKVILRKKPHNIGSDILTIMNMKQPIQSWVTFQYRSIQHSPFISDQNFRSQNSRLGLSLIPILLNSN